MDFTVSIEIEKIDETFPRNCSYDYQSVTSPNVWREYHIDNHPCLKQYTEGDDK